MQKTARLKGGGIARLPYVAFKGTKRHLYKTLIDNNPHRNAILYYDEKGELEKAFHISTLGWQSLAVRLYFLSDYSDIFVPIYSTNGEDTTPLKIWEIHYPSDIKTYRMTTFLVLLINPSSHSSFAYFAPF